MKGRLTESEAKTDPNILSQCGRDDDAGVDVELVMMMMMMMQSKESVRECQTMRACQTMFHIFNAPEVGDLFREVTTYLDFNFLYVFSHL